MDDTPNLPTASTPSRPTWPDLGRELTELLRSEPNASLAVTLISEQPHLKAECIKALPALKALATQPAGAEGVRHVIFQRFGIYPQPERTQAEWGMWWADYVDALADLPEAALEAGMQAHVRSADAEFLPKPGKLLALAESTANAAAKAYSRARQAVERVPPKPFLGERLHVNAPELREIPRPPTEADKARVKAWAAEMVAASAAKHPPPPARANQGKTDETGITPELRALVERQRGMA